MKHTKATIMSQHNESPIMQNGVPVKLLIACVCSCIIGIVLMAMTSRYLLMGVFIGILICVSVTTSLLVAGKISITAACLAPMLLLCFVYTPLSWFTYNGLLGCTPYLSILFITVITLTYFRKIQVLLLSLYGTLMLGLIIHWLATWPETIGLEQVINILVAYILTAAVTVGIIEGVKRKNQEINEHITDLTLRDDLTGLLNRRAIERVLDRLENIFKKDDAEYAVVMLDIDKFKSINDLYGHNLGDSLLKSAAMSIQSSIRTGDYAFRYGGDEFLLILPKMRSETTCQICARIEADLREIKGYAFPLTLSMGCALRSESVSAQDVLKLADLRMYEAKREKNHIESKSATASPSS